MTPHSLGVHKILSLLTPAVRPLLNWNAERRLAAAVNVADVRDAAKARAHKMVFDYLDAGADDEITLRRNKDAFSQIELHYRVLAGLKPPLDLSTRILGNNVDVPFFPSPTAGSKMFHRDGEAGVARAARTHGAMYCLSTMGTTSPRDVAKALEDAESSDSVSRPVGITRREGITNAFAESPHGDATEAKTRGGKLFQLYVWKDRSLVRDLLAQAKENGFRALALTVDLTWYGNRERDTRNGFTVPPAYSLRQTLDALRRPAWTWDFLSQPEYAYAALDVAAEARAARLDPCLRAPQRLAHAREHVHGRRRGLHLPAAVVGHPDGVEAPLHRPQRVIRPHHALQRRRPGVAPLADQPLGVVPAEARVEGVADERHLRAPVGGQRGLVAQLVA